MSLIYGSHPTGYTTYNVELRIYYLLSNLHIALYYSLYNKMKHEWVFIDSTLLQAKTINYELLKKKF
jgi:hypothetical protein